MSRRKEKRLLDDISGVMRLSGPYRRCRGTRMVPDDFSHVLQQGAYGVPTFFDDL